MRFSEAKGRQVVSTSTAATVGKVVGFVVDPEQSAVIALQLNKTESGDTLRWSDLTGFGADAVTVSGADKITDTDAELAALANKAHRVLGKLTLTIAGDALGKISDVDFDPGSGTITAVVIDDIDVVRVKLVGVGSYAVVVVVEVEASR